MRQAFAVLMRLRIMAMTAMMVVIRPDKKNVGKEGSESQYEDTRAGDGAESSTSVMTISPPRRRNANRLDQRCRLVHHLFRFSRESGNDDVVSKRS